MSASVNLSDGNIVSELVTVDEAVDVDVPFITFN